MPTLTRKDLRAMGFRVIRGQAVRVLPRESAPPEPSAPRRAPVFDDAVPAVEGCRDGDTLVLSIAAAPRTKKNSKEHYTRQSRGYRTFAARVLRAVLSVKARLRLPLPDREYNAAVLFVVDNPLPDPVGLYQGLADALEDAGVISSDWFIRSWHGSEVVLDREHSGVHILLTPREPLPGAPTRKRRKASGAS